MSLALRQMRSRAPLATNTPLTCYEPNIPDHFHYSETTEMIFQEQSSDKSTEPFVLVWRGSRRRDHWQSAIFTTVHSGGEKIQRAVDKLITLLKKVCCQLSPFLCVMQERGDPCMNLIRIVHASSLRNERIRILFGKRANCRCFWSRDPRTRVPSRF